MGRMPNPIIVIAVADTHMPRFGRSLPAPLAVAVRGADRILHAGDITDGFVLDLLAREAPTDAVAGNNDPPDLRERLGERSVIEIGGLRIGLTHGHLGPGRTTPERAWRSFADVEPGVDAIVFGHSHQPLVERRGATWLLNPGSPTDRRRQPACTFLRLTIADGELVPELVSL